MIKVAAMVLVSMATAVAPAALWFWRHPDVAAACGHGRHVCRRSPRIKEATAWYMWSASCCLTWLRNGSGAHEMPVGVVTGVVAAPPCYSFEVRGNVTIGQQ